MWPRPFNIRFRAFLRQIVPALLGDMALQPC